MVPVPLTKPLAALLYVVVPTVTLFLDQSSAPSYPVWFSAPKFCVGDTFCAFLCHYILVVTHKNKGFFKDLKLLVVVSLPAHLEHSGFENKYLY